MSRISRLRLASVCAVMSLMMVLLMAGCAATPPAEPGSPVADPLQLGNPKAEFTVSLRSERELLHVGEPLRLDLQTTVSGYLNLYYIGASDNTGQLLTNYPIQADEPVTFPPKGGKKLHYNPGPTSGTETFILVATRQPLNFLGRRDIKNVKKPRTPIAEFNMTGSQLLDRLQHVLHRRTPGDWNAYSLRLQSLPPKGHP